MRNSDDFNPNWISPPGALIELALKKKRMSLDELARALDLSLPEVGSLITGDLTITRELASKLSAFFEQPVGFWIVLEAQYRQDQSNRAYREHAETYGDDG